MAARSARVSEIAQAARRELLRRHFPDVEERKRFAGAQLGGRPPAGQRCTKRLGGRGHLGRFCWGWIAPGTDRCTKHPRPVRAARPAPAKRTRAAVRWRLGVLLRSSRLVRKRKPLDAKLRDVLAVLVDAWRGR